MDSITVIAPGSEVAISASEHCTPEPPTVGVVTGVSIYPAEGMSLRVAYQVAWWIGRERREVWLDAIEVRLIPTDPTDALRIGFAGGTKKQPA